MNVPSIFPFFTRCASLFGNNAMKLTIENDLRALGCKVRVVHIVVR